MKIRSSEQWQLIDSIFGGALALPEDERSSYLDESCGGDARLRAEVERLLRASEAAGDFLEVLDAGQAARLLEDSAGVDGSIGRYRIIRKLGEGGMGVVYLAEDTSLKRQVAVKLLPPWIDASSGANRRLLEEARAASAIDHPNIATVHEIGETDDGRLFITMGYYEGGTLRERIGLGKMSAGAAIGIMLQAAKGISAAHRKGIVHRDIKPENLLLTGDGLVKVADFGLAQVGGTSSTAGKAIGTAAYMSPEQCSGAIVDARTDLWSLGVVLYEMLAGERPFTGSTQNAIFDSVMSASRRADARVDRDVSVRVMSIVDRCLKKDLAARYQSADELIRDLEVVPGRKIVGRRTLVLGAAAILAVAVAGIAGSWQGLRASGQSGATHSGMTSLAVLPFSDLSPAADHEYLSDGITEELIHALAGIENLLVVARSSAFQFKGHDIDVREAGAKLGVGHVLEGSVRRTGDRLRITVRLAEANQGFEVWSQVFDRSADDILAIQSEIAGAVVNALRIRLDPREPPRFASRTNRDAYTLYLKGRHLFNQRTDLQQAITYFRESIAIDASFAPAWTGLGKTWLVMPAHAGTALPQALDSAKAFITKALELDSTLAEAHSALGSMAADDWRWSESEPHFKRALQLDGGDPTTHQWYGEMLLRTGRYDESISELEAARKLDPLTSIIPANLGFALHAAGRQEEAIDAFREAIDFNPRNAQAHVGLGATLIELGRFGEAIVELEKAVELAEGRRSTRAHLARGYALAGRQGDATRIFAELKRDALAGSESPWAVAVVAVSLGQNDEALRWLELAYERRDIAISYLKTSRVFKGMRTDPRFVGLLKRMGL